MKITIAITGASGAIYARRLIEELSNAAEISTIAIVMTKSAKDVASHEIGDIQSFIDSPKIIEYNNDDMFTPIASGSAAFDAMVIIPCSMGMIGRIAGGISNDLISRAADVMLKERLPLIIVPRESPLSLIHLRNMTALTEAGSVILPASPSFYHKPETIDELIESIIERVLKQLKIAKKDSFKWQAGI